METPSPKPTKVANLLVRELSRTLGSFLEHAALPAKKRTQASLARTANLGKSSHG
jgi:hypothetical protein